MDIHLDVHLSSSIDRSLIESEISALKLGNTNLPHNPVLSEEFAPLLSLVPGLVAYLKVAASGATGHGQLSTSSSTSATGDISVANYNGLLKQPQLSSQTSMNGFAPAQIAASAANATQAATAPVPPVIALVPSAVAPARPPLVVPAPPGAVQPSPSPSPLTQHMAAAARIGRETQA